ncbi:MAG: NAD(+)/NADH kinase [Chitinophagaceae bacterium]|nr:NAD(+)/NADH kinase [Oligoflexus sp.]
MTKALIVRKPTNLEQHQALEAKHSIKAPVDDSYRHFLEKSHNEHMHSLKVLRETLDSHNVRYSEVKAGEDKPEAHFDCVIALGGDGTLITSSYYINDATPLIGIRSSSASVGFLCAGDHQHIPAIIEAFQSNQLRYTERNRLLAHVHRRDGTIDHSSIAALNDFLFAASSPAATTRYNIGFLGRTETHKSSGVWIATATGSTAAIGAAGGTFMGPADRHFQFLVRELYQKSEEGLLLSQGFCDPQSDNFWLESQSPESILALDGEKLVMKVGFGERVTFTLAEPVRVANPF